MNKTTQYKQIYSHIHCLSLVWTYAYNCFQFISIITRHWTLCQVAHVILTSSNCFACKTKKIPSSLQPLRVYKRLTNSKRTHTHNIVSPPCRFIHSLIARTPLWYYTFTTYTIHSNPHPNIAHIYIHIQHNIAAKQLRTPSG